MSGRRLRKRQINQTTLDTCDCPGESTAEGRFMHGDRNSAVTRAHVVRVHVCKPVETITLTTHSQSIGNWSSFRHGERITVDPTELRTLFSPNNAKSGLFILEPWPALLLLGQALVRRLHSMNKIEMNTWHNVSKPGERATRSAAASQTGERVRPTYHIIPTTPSPEHCPPI